MKKILIAVAMLFSFTAFAEETVPNTYDHGLYLQMVEESEIVVCREGECRYLVDGLMLDEPQGIPDGITAVFPEGMFTVDQIEYYSPLINDYWHNFIAVVSNKVKKDCASNNFTAEQRQEMFCAELFAE